MLNFIRELLTPESYDNSPYNYVRNQLAHWAIGFMAPALVSPFLFAYYGEFAPKGILFGIFFMLFATWEVAQRLIGYTKVDLWDHLEDWMFMAVYGSGASIFLFNEVHVGSTVMHIDLKECTPVVIVVLLHLLMGALSRSNNKNEKVLG